MRRYFPVISNEPVENNAYDANYDQTIGDGHTTNDSVVATNGEIYLQAERSGVEDGRICTIAYSATDASGNSV